MYELSGKLTWITGASSGLGRELALQFAKQGAQLILSARSVEALEETRAKCRSPHLHRVLPFDAGEPRSVDRALSSLEEMPRILVHNAGVSQRALSYETDASVAQRITQINYLTPVRITRALLPGMIDRKEGLIVAVSSVASLAGIPLRSAYAASKAALNVYMEAVAAETHSAGIRVTVVYPGFVNTNISVNALTKDGTPHKVMDATHEHSMQSSKAAETIVRKLPARRVWVGMPLKLKLLRTLARYAPRLLAVILRT